MVHKWWEGCKFVCLMERHLKTRETMQSVMHMLVEEGSVVPPSAWTDCYAHVVFAAVV